MLAPPLETEPPLDDDQRAALEHACGPLLVLGSPGSGKTTLLVAAALRELSRRTPGGPEPLVLTFSRRAASDLRNRIVRGLGCTTAPPLVMTTHAFCLWMLSRSAGPGEVAPRLLTAPEQEFRVRELLIGGGPARWPPELAAAIGTRGFARQVRGVLARARQLGLDPEDLVSAGVAAGRPDWGALGRFFEEYLDVLDHEGALDYAELVHRCRIRLTEPEVVEALRREVSSVLVDEFQELDPAQIGLLRAMVPPGGSILAVADPDQAIFGFRGAHPRAVAEFPGIFTGTGGSPATVLVLRGSHRFDGVIGGALRSLTRRLPLPALPAALTRELRSPVSRTGPGQVAAYTCSSESDQADLIAGVVRAAHLEDGLPYGDMAVVVRSGRRQLAPVARALAAAGVPVEVAGDETPLSAELAVRPLLLALDVVGRGQCDADEAQRLLSSPLAGLDAVALRALGRQLQAAERDLVGSAVAVPTGAELMAAVLAEPARLPEHLQTREAAGLRRFATLLTEASATLATPGNGVAEVLWTLWSRSGWPALLKTESASGGASGRQADRALDAVAALFETAADTEQPPGPTGVRGFLAEVAALEIPADTEREAEVLGRGVRLLTAHRAKGREWPLVIVAGVQEGLWPDPSPPGSVLSPRELVSDGIVPESPGRTTVVEERRLFHVACSRASRRLVVTAVAGSEGEANQPSRFLAELGVPVSAHRRTERPLTFPALTAELRRVATSADASPPLRRAAVARLAALAMLTEPEGRPLVPQADPARWWGVLPPTGGPVANPGPIRLSATELTGLLACPRQYFLARRAHAEPVRSSAAGLGSVIHVLAEHARTDGLSASELLAELDSVWEAIPFDAGWMSAGERVEAELALTRFVNWQQANDHADVVGVEVPFEVQVDVDGQPVTLVGTVDRLERCADGRLRIVDFKTGRHLPTRAQVEVQEQVGLYQLAADSGAFAEVSGSSAGSAGAILVYLRQSDSVEDHPRQLVQAALTERPHPDPDPAAQAYPSWVHHRVARAARILREGCFDATPGEACRWCTFAASCPTQEAGRQVIG